MEKKPFVTREQLEEIKKTYPTPFHLYDEKGIRENGERLMRAFSWNKGFREYFAVKATPNPFVIDILKKLGCGVDCSSLTELMMAKAMKYDGEKIMFSSNDTPPEEFKMAAELGRKTRPSIHLGICGEHGGDPTSVEFCHKVGLNYVSCSPYRVPIARLAAAQAAIKSPR